jgi:2-polyprenyl-3-methyl-5-hydroxy-6-metoxy-1,4-benzoquinol methylase
MVLLEIAEKEMARRAKMAEDAITQERPELLELFFTYQNEALAARRFLDSSLRDLDHGVEILEVGGGVLALAVQLAYEGFKVTTVEPVGEGFTDISYIMNIFLQIAKEEKIIFTLVNSPIEDCKFGIKFDFIFSINVMEHLKDPYSVLVQLVKNLKAGCFYRFFCPNYDFPYEPHFGKWLRLRTENAFFLPQNRAVSTLIPEKEIQGLYTSLNFLTLKKIKKVVKHKNISLSANHNTLYEVMIRSIYDSELKKRHRGLTKLVRFFYFLRLHYIAKLIPVNYQPIMDVTVTLSPN